MSLIQRVLNNLEERRQRILNGEINSIPSPLSIFPGIEKATYYLISGASKGGKTQIASYLFLYIPILYAYYHPERLRIKIFYFPLEETPERITMRFMCHLLYILSNRKIRISPAELRSINKNKVVSPEILKLLNSIQYRSILDFYEDHVHFISEKNPTGVWKTIKNYAEEAGTIHKKKISIKNKETGVEQEIEVFDYYEPKDPEEYVIVMLDHAGLISQERGMSKKEAIDKLSEYFKDIRNYYGHIPVLLQQQNTDTLSLEAFKANKIRPTLNGLKDTKNTGQDCNMMLGITNPSAFEVPEYPSGKGYDIRQLKGFARFLEIVLNRDGESNDLLGLYFDGATNFFSPLPPSNDLISLQKIYNHIQALNNSKTK